MPAWTDAMDKILTREAAAGSSASQIATCIAGATRNAVIGRAHRLKIQIGVSRVPVGPKAETGPAPKAGGQRRPARPHDPGRIAIAPRAAAPAGPAAPKRAPIPAGRRHARGRRRPPARLPGAGGGAGGRRAPRPDGKDLPGAAMGRQAGAGLRGSRARRRAALLRRGDDRRLALLRRPPRPLPRADAEERGMSGHLWTEEMVAVATAGILGGDRYRVVAAAVQAVAGRPINEHHIESFAARRGVRRPRGRRLPEAWAAEAAEIVAAVAAAWGVLPEALMGPLGPGKCAGPLTAARWAAIAALRDRTRLSVLDIGKAMRLDRSTVKNALERTDAARAAAEAADAERAGRVAALRAEAVGILAEVAADHGLAPEAVAEAPDTAGRRARAVLCGRLADEKGFSADQVADATGLPAPMVRAILRRIADQRRIMAEMAASKPPAPPPPARTLPGSDRAMRVFGRFDVGPAAQRPDCRPDPRQWWQDSMPMRGPLGFLARQVAA